MLSVLLQGAGGGGGGGGGGGHYYGGGGLGGSCSTGCIVGILVGIFVPTILCVVAVVCYSARRRRRANDAIAQSKQAAAQDRRELYLSADGQPHNELTEQVDTKYRGSTRNNAAKRAASFPLHIDNVNRTISGAGSDAWGPFDVRGQLIIGSPTQGWLTFTKSYPTHSCEYAGQFDAQSQPLAVSGSWSTTAGTSDFGSFTLTFKQPLSIVNSASEATVAVPIHDHAGDDYPATGGTPTDVEMQAPPPAYEQQPPGYQYQTQQTEAY